MYANYCHLVYVTIWACDATIFINGSWSWSKFKEKLAPGSYDKCLGMSESWEGFGLRVTELEGK